jgi:hypothetical protein
MAIRSSIPFRNKPQKAEGRDPLRDAAFIPVQVPSALLYGHLPGFFFLLTDGLNLVLRIGRDLLFGERQHTQLLPGKCHGLISGVPGRRVNG